LELISDKLPLPKSMEKELTLWPAPLTPCVRTYNNPAGREEELPQFSKNKLRAQIARSARIPPIFLNINSPRRFPSAGDSPPAVTEPEACG
jgi:hypothetical protein